MAEAPYASFKIDGRELSLSAPGLRPAADMPQERLRGDLKRFKENTWPLCRHNGLLIRCLLNLGDVFSYRIIRHA